MVYHLGHWEGSDTPVRSCKISKVGMTSQIQVEWHFRTLNFCRSPMGNSSVNPLLLPSQCRSCGVNLGGRRKNAAGWIQCSLQQGEHHVWSSGPTVDRGVSIGVPQARWRVKSKDEIMDDSMISSGTPYLWKAKFMSYVCLRLYILFSCRLKESSCCGLAVTQWIQKTG